MYTCCLGCFWWQNPHKFMSLPCMSNAEAKLSPVTAWPLWMPCQSFHPVWTELGHTQIKAVGRALLQELGNCPFVLPTAHSPHNRRLLLGTTRRMGYMNIFVCWDLWARVPYKIFLAPFAVVWNVLWPSRNIWEQAYISMYWTPLCTPMYILFLVLINLISLYRDRECIIYNFVCWALWAVMQLCKGTIQHLSGIICCCLECIVIPP